MTRPTEVTLQHAIDTLITEVQPSDDALIQTHVCLSRGELLLLLHLTRSAQAQETRRSRAGPAFDALIQALEEGLEDLDCASTN
ncbi:hypothetical protein Dxin01_00823 [Deinococcus xinjiangensis]|uniref:Uncharacterized protein n=1 Tax=Deinococcus xinjiangensis TaxID=457454 RepID=A0ABP9V748_9DEIO